MRSRAARHPTSLGPQSARGTGLSRCLLRRSALGGLPVGLVIGGQRRDQGLLCDADRGFDRRGLVQLRDGEGLRQQGGFGRAGATGSLSAVGPTRRPDAHGPASAAPGVARCPAAGFAAPPGRTASVGSSQRVTGVGLRPRTRCADRGNDSPPSGMGTITRLAARSPATSSPWWVMIPMSAVVNTSVPVCFGKPAGALGEHSRDLGDAPPRQQSALLVGDRDVMMSLSPVGAVEDLPQAFLLVVEPSRPRRPRRRPNGQRSRRNPHELASSPQPPAEPRSR